jgi:trk system potassium uptake protein TrkH
MLSGLFLWYRYRRCKRELKPRDGFLMVVLVWTVLPAFAACPNAAPGAEPHRRLFRDGLRPHHDRRDRDDRPRHAPMSINLWRHRLNWLGGMGLIVLAVAILPLLGIGGRQMCKAEVPGPMKDARMTPRIAETAKGLWLVYIGITVLCILATAGPAWAGSMPSATPSRPSRWAAFRRTMRASAISHRPRSNTSRSFSCSFPASTTPRISWP